MDKKNKVTYGLKNVYYAPITAEDETKVEYGTPVRMPGAGSISLPKNVEKILIPADDDPEYATIVDNKGYDGDLTLYDVPDSYLEDCLGMTITETGIVIENKDDKPKPFALMFEFNGDALKKRHVLYRCMGTKPDITSQTKGDGTTANNVTLPITATPAKDTGDIKASCNEDDTANYTTWFTMVMTRAKISEE